jgi:lysophospholipase L1-like esterase
MKRKKQFFRKIILLLFSFLFSIIIAMLAINFYLKFTNKGKHPQYMDWTITEAKYNLTSVYWRLPFCKKNEDKCQYFEERLVPHQVEFFNQKINNNDCKTILFLGDSFTDAPWIEKEKSFPHLFSEKLANYNNECIKEIRVSTGGSGTSQQLAELTKLTKKINPDLVVWQFCENDVYENIKTPVHKIKNEKLVFSSAITNFQFWAGYLNQKIPFLKESTLGQHLMYLGEKKDVFRNWQANINDGESLRSYNKKFITLLIDEMKELSIKNKFELITTISPLECNFISSDSCYYSKANQKLIEDTLKENSNFISMETEDYQQESLPFSPDENFYQQMFNSIEDRNPIGHRHLSELGNLYFGEILFNNYIENTEKQLFISIFYYL